MVSWPSLNVWKGSSGLIESAGWRKAADRTSPGFGHSNGALDICRLETFADPAIEAVHRFVPPARLMSDGAELLLNHVWGVSHRSKKEAGPFGARPDQGVRV